MLKLTLLLPSAALLMAGCAISTGSLKTRTPPEECVQEVAELKALPTGMQTEEEAWIADAAPKYAELAKNYNCLLEWADRDPNEE